MFTYLSLVTLPPAFAALTVFAATGRLPSLLAPIARLAHPVHGTVQPRGLPDGLPAGRAAVTTLLYHGLIVARSAPSVDLAAPVPVQAADPRPGAGPEPEPTLPFPSPVPDAPGGDARTPVRPPTDSPTTPGTVVYETPVLNETPVLTETPVVTETTAPPIVTVVPPLEPPPIVVPPVEAPVAVGPPAEPPVVLVPPVEQDAGSGLALGQVAHVGGVGAGGSGNGLGRTVGPAAPSATEAPKGWTDHGSSEPAHGASDDAPGKTDDVPDSPPANGEADVTAHVVGTDASAHAANDAGPDADGNGNGSNASDAHSMGRGANDPSGDNGSSKKPKP